VLTDANGVGEYISGDLNGMNMLHQLTDLFSTGLMGRGTSDQSSGHCFACSGFVFCTRSGMR
jgi:hypothetical protein